MRKGLFIILGVGLILLIILVMVFSPAKKITIPTTAPTPTPVFGPNQANQVDYTGLFPNKSVAQGMSEKLAKPEVASQKDGYTVYSYKTDNPRRENELYIQGNTAKYFVEQITTENSHYTDFLAKTPGLQPRVFYDPVFVNTGFKWYVFPENGIAFLADQNTGYTARILYFSPTTYQNFLQTAGKTFSLSVSDSSTEDGKGGEGVQGYP